ncbi:MAG: SDR family oxidoreductase [Bacilli bacterium]|nr:SDR family oxidoreductase [Bacilli bacterium]
MRKLARPRSLEGKVIVVTGAGGVLCGEMAKELARCKAKVAVLDLNLAKAQEVVDSIEKEGGVAKAYACNVLRPEELKAVHETINADFGKIDVLLNGAGGNSPKATTSEEYFQKEHEEGAISFFDLKQEGVEFVFDLNFMGTFLPTQEFAKDMVGREGCSILNVSSMNAFTPLTKIPAYSGAKAAVSNFTKWLAVHFSKIGIRVNAIAPGFLVTAQNKGLLFDEEGNPTPRTNKILEATPMHRFGEADELLGAVLFLLDEEASSFITGVVLPIDGGFSSYSGV